MNRGIYGNSRANGGDPARPIATLAACFDGTDNGSVVTPRTMSLSRRGTGRAWFWELFSDFTMVASGQAAGSDGCNWFTQISGTGADANLNSNNMQSFPGRSGAGLLSLITGTTSSGRAGIDSTLGVVTHRYDTGVSFMEHLVYLPNLADTTDDYVFRIGHFWGTGSQSEQFGFEYNRANSTNWQGLASFNGNSTRWDTGVPVQAAKWIILRARWTDTVATFQVNDLPTVSGSSSNIRPDGFGRLGAHILKTAGTTSRTAIVDYCYFRHDFTNERTWS